MTPEIILPIVHLNGTSRDALVEERLRVAHAINDARTRLFDMGPNGRDYYPKPGLYEQAVAQHRRRVETLTALYDEMMAEVQQLADGANNRGAR